MYYFFTICDSFAYGNWIWKRVENLEDFSCFFCVWSAILTEGSIYFLSRPNLMLFGCHITYDVMHYYSRQQYSSVFYLEHVFFGIKCNCCCRWAVLKSADIIKIMYDAFIFLDFSFHVPPFNLFLSISFSFFLNHFSLLSLYFFFFHLSFSCLSHTLW